MVTWPSLAAGSQTVKTDSVPSTRPWDEVMIVASSFSGPTRKRTLAAGSMFRAQRLMGSPHHHGTSSCHTMCCMQSAVVPDAPFTSEKTRSNVVSPAAFSLWTASRSFSTAVMSHTATATSENALQNGLVAGRLNEPSNVRTPVCRSSKITS